MKKVCFLLALGICGFLSSCTTSRTYHVTETTYLDTGPIVKESVVVVERAPRVYVESFGPDYIIVERPYCGRFFAVPHRFYHRHSMCYHHYPRSYSEVHFGFGFHN
jgi:hypothetical protein